MKFFDFEYIFYYFWPILNALKLCLYVHPAEKGEKKIAFGIESRVRQHKKSFTFSVANTHYIFPHTINQTR